jgi:hypothetical protein
MRWGTKAHVFQIIFNIQYLERFMQTQNYDELYAFLQTIFLLICNQDAAPQVVLRALPQAAPRVEGAVGHRGRLRSPRRIHHLQHVVGECGAFAAGLAPSRFVGVDRLPQLPHHPLALGLRSSRLPETELPRFPPHQVQSKLWQLWSHGQNLRN